MQMASVNISDRPLSSKNQSMKKFAKRKVSVPKRKVAKHNSKIQKPSFKKTEKLLKPNDVKGKCFYCDEQCYWKRNYPLYFAELKKKEDNVPISQLDVLEANFIKKKSLI